MAEDYEDIREAIESQQNIPAGACNIIIARAELQDDIDRLRKELGHSGDEDV